MSHVKCYKMGFLKTLFWIIIIIVIIAIVVAVFIYLAAPQRLNILVVGSDQRAEERGRSDVLIVFSVPKSPNEPTTLLSIPRDTLVEIEDRGQDKITHAYAYGDREEDTILGNIELTQQTVEEFLNAPMHGTVEVTFKGFEEIIDMQGGISVSSGDLNGEEALTIVRDRFRAGGDFARAEDQREIFLSLFSKMKNVETLREVYDYFQNSDQGRIRLNKPPIAAFGAATFVRRFGNLELGEVTEQVIPGKGESRYSSTYGQNLYYWVPDLAATEELVDEYLR